MFEESGRVIRRECDEPMARSKRLLPCNKDCKNCMACIETTDTGERRHCTNFNETNVIQPERKLKITPNEKQWSDIEKKRLLFLREQGLNWGQIGERMHRSAPSVSSQYRRLLKEGEVNGVS